MNAKEFKAFKKEASKIDDFFRIVPQTTHKTNFTTTKCQTCLKIVYIDTGLIHLSSEPLRQVIPRKNNSVCKCKNPVLE